MVRPLQRKGFDSAPARIALLCASGWQSSTSSFITNDDMKFLKFN
jgi:hypothetical protein